MKNLTFHIVGLTHNDVKGHEVEYAKEAEGRTICLVPDDANTFDMLAVKAYDKQQLIGYVSALEGEDVRALIIARKERNLRTRCIGCNSKNEGDKAGLQLMVRALSDVSDEEMEQARREIYDDKIYDDWQYSGPVLPIEQLTRFSDCTMMLEGVINSIIRLQNTLSEGASDKGSSASDNSSSASDKTSSVAENRFLDAETEVILREDLADCLSEARERLSSFLEIQRSDYSREMTQARSRILHKLEQIDDEELQRLRAVLLTEMGFITSSAYRERAAYSFFVEAPNAIKKKQTGTYDYKDQLDAIEQQLHAFPHNLYPTFKADPVDFLRQVFYKRVPRKKMLQLLSGIVLMIMNGRVDDVKQWGKHGDEESMKAMKAVGAKPSNEVKKEKFMELVDLVIPKIAVYKKKGCPELLVKKQSDWFPVFRLLNGWGLFDMGAPTAFCKHLAHLYEKLPPENTERAPLCKWKDLTQAKSAPFEYAALEWWKLDSGELGSVSKERFNRYCDIVNAFKMIMGTTASSENVNLREILPKLVDEKVPTSNTMKDDEMMASDGS
ncbi:hypothetical protein [Segatella copri]|uniref:Uncharacterized protein n=1 Tax=Segatella copri DSM 18205 TaxID=537011 RepID=D1PGA6_9BACT|nr:hypothetical protein [Segatella copri]EFB34271.1 hypothetical protein PREVCOP_06270 [Segatella copri DSM 18205]MCW4097133.1 hypothetical protein [Segatella copri]MQP18942.1 hypothetical protein [Segatella copri DSM 18205]UEA43370.1 hypothetical protein LK433_01965 [Segatella copri DSM 18205]UWP52019.1 hypothetical protein NQ544_12050 [Segatella copri DSM 18205]